ncbi:hypothetical protein HI914_04471 [Erysiphe necator]|nr:hypothetical protein HI914_04471 [Erysiphe necator]
MLSSIDQQKTANYWASQNPLPIEAIPPSSTQQPPRGNQTESQFEGETLVSSAWNEPKRLLSTSIKLDVKQKEIVDKQGIKILTQNQTVELQPPAIPSIPDYQNPRKVAEQQNSVLMPGSKPNSPAPTVPLISDEQCQHQSPENNGFHILPNTADPEDSYNESDDSNSAASVHSEFSDRSHDMQPVENEGN